MRHRSCGTEEREPAVWSTICGVQFESIIRHPIASYDRWNFFISMCSNRVYALEGRSLHLWRVGRGFSPHPLGLHLLRLIASSPRWCSESPPNAPCHVLNFFVWRIKIVRIHSTAVIRRHRRARWRNASRQFDRPSSWCTFDRSYGVQSRRTIDEISSYQCVPIVCTRAREGARSFSVVEGQPHSDLSPNGGPNGAKKRRCAAAVLVPWGLALILLHKNSLWTRIHLTEWSGTQGATCGTLGGCFLGSFLVFFVWRASFTIMY